jgi:K(+)-stimulated pyrophosphate-energized sodium pump
MNPIIKFTTLFGLLAVELATEMQTRTRLVLAAIFFAISVVFVWRSFYRMRIEVGIHAAESERVAQKAA